ncbi:MAG: hypothetical protein K1X74_05670 [Pirellulales bacterium]|nr:hypothetical protein [Pirellulales bacterium]
MKTLMLRAALVACALSLALAAERAAAQGPYYTPTVPNELFYNFYTQGGASRVPAQLYISPRPTPELVGHTYITYQPFMAHEFLYKHKRDYYRYNPTGGFTITRVHWW